MPERPALQPTPEESLGHPEPLPERSLAMHRDQLKPEVRKYADNLHAQALRIFEEQGVANLEEFAQKIKSRMISSKQAEHLEKLLEELQRTYRSDALPEHLEPLPASQLEKSLNLREQYESQVSLLERIGLIQELPQTHTLGLIGLDDKEYPLPSYRQIQERLRPRENDLATKATQGFTRLLIVPFGRRLLDLAKVYGDLLKDHQQRGLLLGENGEPVDIENPAEPVRLTSLLAQKTELDNKGQTILVPDRTSGADETGAIVYYPRTFTKSNHGGNTKRELLRYGQGFSLLLLEQDLTIPRKKTTRVIGNRRKPPAGFPPSAYLHGLNKNKEPYNLEVGLTPEDWLTLSIYQLETTNQVLDDFRGIVQRGSTASWICFLIGSFLNISGTVPYASFGRSPYVGSSEGRAYLREFRPDGASDDIGFRSAVKL